SSPQATRRRSAFINSWPSTACSSASDSLSPGRAGDILGRLSARLGLWCLIFFPLAFPAVVVGIVALFMRSERRWPILGIGLGSIILGMTIVTAVIIAVEASSRH